MKNFVLIIALFFTCEVSAQSFSFTTEHTSISDTLGQEIVFDFLLTNISQDTIIVFIKRSQNVLPAGWDCSLCFDINCFAPFVDSVATTPDFGSEPIPPGDTVDFSVHIISGVNSGTAYVNLFAGNLTDRNDTMSVYLTASAPLVGINEPVSSVGSFRLLQNYPNPFNPSTNIVFEIDKQSIINLDVYNINGEKVASAASGEYAPGIYSIPFNAEGLSSGIYLVRLNSGSRNQMIKLLLEK